MINNILKHLFILVCLPIALFAQTADDIEKANGYAEKGQYEEALSLLNYAIAQDPASARAYKVRGHVYIAKGEHSEALADLTKVINLVPDQAKPYADRAIVHYKMGNKGLALSDISAAERLAPASGWILAVKDKLENEDP